MPPAGLREPWERGLALSPTVSQDSDGRRLPIVVQSGLMHESGPGRPSANRFPRKFEDPDGVQAVSGSHQAAAPASIARSSRKRRFSRSALVKPSWRPPASSTEPNPGRSRTPTRYPRTAHAGPHNIHHLLLPKLLGARLCMVTLAHKSGASLRTIPERRAPAPSKLTHDNPHSYST